MNTRPSNFTMPWEKAETLAISAFGEKQTYTMSALLAIFMAALLWVGNATAAVKSGVEPNVLSLPSGPGSIEGLGESFNAQLNSGTASYEVPLEVPPGRAGFAPELVVSYNSGYGNGIAGAGWRLSVPYLQRQTDKRLPYYTDWPSGDQTDNDGDGQIDEFDEFDTYIYVGAEADGEELVPVSSDTFRLENEGAFLHLRRVRGGTTDGWVVHRPDGTQLKFGLAPQARIQDGQGRVFRWCLEQMVDPNGNTITFRYQKLDTSLQVYLQAIDYNPSDSTGMTIQFTYAPRPDILTDYRPGYELKTAYRLNTINMSAAGTLVRAYRFSYHPFTAHQPLSLLSFMTRIGRDNTSALPPASFEYTPFSTAGAATVAMPSAPALTLNDSNIDIIDLNADGLPDVLDTRSASSAPHRYFLNQGPDASGVPQWRTTTSMASLTPLFLGSTGTQLADIDGDGRSDLLSVSGSQSRYYRVNNTTLSWESAGFVGDPGLLLSDPAVRLVDVNNDKRIDIMRASGGYHNVVLNLAGGKWSKTFSTVSPNALLGFNLSYVKLADMNGDRLLDLVQLQNGICAYYPALGMGKFGARVIMDGAPSGIYSDAYVFMMDINGDGRSDVVYVNGSKAQAWVNLGLQTTNHTRGRFAPYFLTNGPYSASTSTAFRTADVNGNGSVDLLWNRTGTGAAPFAFIDFAPGEQPYQLKRIKNGIGAVTTLTYRSVVQEMVRDRDAGRSWPKGVAVPFQIVTQSEVNSGIESQRYVNQYAYHDGFYDGVEREFRGFAAADSTAIGDDAQGAPALITAQLFDLGITAKALKGKLRLQETRDNSGAVFWRERTDWEARVLIPGQSGDTRSVVFPAQIARTRTVIEKDSGTPVDLQWAYDYDTYGNIIRAVEHGRTDSSTWDDERVTQSIYSAAYPTGRAAWMLNKLVERKTQDETGSLIAKQRRFYDDEQFAGNNLGTVSRGNLTMVLDWHDPSSSTAFVRSERKRYDAWGNVTHLFDPLWGTASGHSTEIAYDTAFQTFAVRETIDTGDTLLTAQADYDAGLGVMTQSTDFNQHSTAYTYDTHGRLTSIVRPGDNVFTPTVSFGYALAQSLADGRIVNWIETQRREVSGTADTVDARSYFDGLGRQVMTRAEGEYPGQIVVSGAVEFNARAGRFKEYLPYFDNGTLDFNDALPLSAHVQTHYDALGRVVRVAQPSTGAADPPYATTTYTPLIKTVRDEEQTKPASPRYGSAKRYHYDGLWNDNGEGRLRQVDEIVKLTDSGTPGVPVAWSTRYTYDLLGNLIKLQDAQGNTRTSQYDGLSRETLARDPNRGDMTYGYDAAGNIAFTVDAKGQEIVYAYDGANRVVGEYYFTTPRANVGTVPTRAPDIAYYYDQPPSGIGTDSRWAENTLGSLVWVSDASGEVHQSYDARGRLSWQAKLFNAPGFTAAYFFTEHDYDSMDRPTGLTYPDGVRVSYLYNTRGLLGSIPNVVPGISYNPSGQPIQTELAAGAVSDYDYDARQRLTRILTTRDDGLILQDLQYGFDDVSNITAISDGRTDSHLDRIGTELGITSVSARRFRDSANYAYDDLYRLTGMTQPHSGDAIAYRYDRIGNMLFQGSAKIAQANFGEMRYGGSGGAWNRAGRNPAGPPGPHALSTTTLGGLSPTGLSLSYDGNGNVSLLAQTQLIWDAKDRITGAVTSQANATYVYDHNNTRKIKTVTNKSNGAQQTDLYIDKFSELRQGKLAKYVYVGKNRVARTDQDGTSNSNYNPDYYYLTQHIGSTALTLNQQGQVAEAHSYLPYGDVRFNSASLSAANSTLYAFTGKERDAESQLNYFEQRYLAAPLGRFMSTDPITITAARLFDPQQFNTYAYARANPNTYIDPTGASIWTKVIKFAYHKGDTAATFADVAENIAVAANPAAPLSSRIWAGVSILTEFAPVGINDLKAAKNLITGSSKSANAADAAGDATKKSGVPGDDFVPNPNVTQKYTRPSGAGPTTAQKASVQGKPCVDCGAITPKQVADHKDPLVVQHYREGSVNVQQQSQLDAVQPHCPTCSNIQGGQLGAFGKKMKKDLGL